MNVIETRRLSKRYRRGVWALREATVAVPEGRVEPATGQQQYSGRKVAQIVIEMLGV